MMRLCTLTFAAVLQCAAVAAAAPPPLRHDDASACVAASAAVQRAARLPPRLLDAIGLVETGRLDPLRHVYAPWPWSINANGEGHMYDSKAEAITAVMRLQAAGIDSIDVGCMQINLHHHPDAFASLDAAFDPAINTTYAGRFLWQLYGQTGSWPQAAAAYHSQTPSLAQPYAARVMAAWPDAARYGGTVSRFAGAVMAPLLVDPDNVLTVRFQARLRADAAFRAARDAAMRGHVNKSGLPTLLARFGPLPMRRAAIAHPQGWRDAAR